MQSGIRICKSGGQERKYMQLNTLPKSTISGRRRLGQGHGSGRVKTAGRGTKGQKSRNKVPSYFEGGAVPLIKRLPFLRGKGRNKSFKKKPVIINVNALNRLPKGATVNVKTLIAHNIVEKDKAQTYGVKILGNGQITTAFTVQVAVSQGARQKIEKAGGTVTG